MDYWNIIEETPEALAQDVVDINLSMSEVMTRCEEAVDKRGKPLKKKDVNFVLEIADDVPTLTGDQQKISLILFHLVMNAFKFTTKGHVKVACEYDRASNGLKLEVSDSGIGVAKKSFTRIFEPFQQE